MDVEDGVSEGGVRCGRSLDPRALHASVAALLGPSAAGRADFREGADAFSPNLEDRRVVRIVCFSGLGDRYVRSALGGTLRAGGLEFDRVYDVASPVCDLSPDCGVSDTVRIGNGGRGETAGRDRSEYVTDGIVPLPIEPFVVMGEAKGLGVLDGLPPVSELVSSSLEAFRASKRSSLSLH